MISMPGGAIITSVLSISKNFLITVRQSYFAKALSALPGSCIISFHKFNYSFFY
ncbi:hypothetical protein HanIR_Chr16g0842431 [Helianthus annuus]|nr:hypothetical protein HanIR_Chr16g0842431 [Helianthus annuus]